MKKIVLHGPATDNAGQYRDSGSELEIGTKHAAGMITAERARELVAKGGAVSATAAAAEEKTAANETVQGG